MEIISEQNYSRSILEPIVFVVGCGFVYLCINRPCLLARVFVSVQV